MIIFCWPFLTLLSFIVKPNLFPSFICLSFTLFLLCSLFAFIRQFFLSTNSQDSINFPFQFMRVTIAFSLVAPSLYPPLAYNFRFLSFSPQLTFLTICSIVMSGYALPFCLITLTRFRSSSYPTNQFLLKLFHIFLLILGYLLICVLIIASFLQVSLEVCLFILSS